jgi:hypothetical protein
MERCEICGKTDAIQFPNIYNLSLCNYCFNSDKFRNEIHSIQTNWTSQRNLALQLLKCTSISNRAFGE